MNAMNRQPGLQRRPRRLRRNPALRRLLAETTLTPTDLIYPLFVRHGEGQRLPLPAMPGQAQISVDQLAAEARELLALGIPGVMLFGIPARKDADGSENYDPDGIAARAIREAEGGRAGADRLLGPLLLQLHRPWPLRHSQPGGERPSSAATAAGLSAQRRQPGDSGARRGSACRSRRRLHRALGACWTAWWRPSARPSTSRARRRQAS